MNTNLSTGIWFNYVTNEQNIETIELQTHEQNDDPCMVALLTKNNKNN